MMKIEHKVDLCAQESRLENASFSYSTFEDGTKRPPFPCLSQWGYGSLDTQTMGNRVPDAPDETEATDESNTQDQ